MQTKGQDAKYKVKQCKICPIIEDIQSFSFNGVSARFQVQRKHMMSKNPLDLHKQAFYSWDCITLSIGKEEVDLVIKDQSCMDKLLKLLIYRTNTIDGVKDSGLKIQNIMV